MPFPELIDANLGARRLCLAFAVGVAIAGVWWSRRAEVSDRGLSTGFPWLSFRKYAAVLGLAALFAAAISLFAILARQLWRPLSGLTLSLVGAELKWFFPELVMTVPGATIDTGRLKVSIEASCSGYEGIGLTSAFLGIYVGLFRSELRFPRALVLIPGAVVLAWLGNSIRISLLILIGHFISKEIALQGFHYQSGWLFFLGISLGAVTLTQRLSYFRKAPAEPWDNDAAPYIAPLLVMLASGMATGLFLERNFDWLYPLRVISTGGVLFYFRKSYSGEGPSRKMFVPVLLGVLVALLWIRLAPSTSAMVRATPVKLARLPQAAAIAWLGVKVLGYVLVSPIVEELAFRKYLIPSLEALAWVRAHPWLRNWFPALASAGLFAALHEGTVAGLAAGLCYSFAFLRARRAGDAILAHAVTNAVLAFIALWTNDWSFWS